MNMMKKNGGFTLVELIVVIAILAILAGVAVPAYSGYIKKAQDAAITVELDAISSAAQAANATKGAVTKIEIAPATGVVTFTYDPTTPATSFNSDFIAFYKNATVDASGVVTVTGYTTEIAGTSFEGKTATWTPSTAWEAK